MLNGAVAPEPVSRWIASELFERLPISVSVVDSTLSIVMSNATFAAVFGDPAARTCYQVYKKREEACPACPVAKIFRDGICRVAEASGIDCIGDRADYVVHHTPIFDASDRVSFVVNMSYDVTVAHQFSEELRQESAFRQNITESALDALVAADEAERITVYNPAAERLFGLRRAEVVGQLTADRFYPEPFLALMHGRHGAGSLILPEVEVRDGEGALIPVRFSGTVLRSGGRRVGTAAFLQDLRTVKRLEREKLDSERMAAVGQTVTQLAHSIKNILTGLQGGLYDIRTGQTRHAPDRVEEGLRTLERNFGRVTVLVRDFLRFSREHRLELRACDPNRVAEEVFDLYREAAARNQIELTLERAPAAGQALLDAEALHTCLANLVANAIDACIAAGRPACTVRLVVEREGDLLRYAVEDSGCGIGPDVREKLFCSIFTTKGMCGSGLGLMMTKKIVEDHGGRVQVTSEPGRGARFTLEIPVAGNPAATEGEAHARIDSGGR